MYVCMYVCMCPFNKIILTTYMEVKFYSVFTGFQTQFVCKNKNPLNFYRVFQTEMSFLKAIIPV